MDEISERVITVLAETQQLDREKVSPESTFEQLGIDSFDGINLLFAIESEFDIHVPDDEAKNLRSVRELIEGVEKLIAAKQPPAER